MKRALVYLAGPMRGYPDLNRQAFQKAADRLRKIGYDVFCPPEEDDAAFGVGAEWSPEQLAKAMRRNIAALLESDVVALLPGWERSRGAVLEAEIGFQIGIPVRNFSPDVGFTALSTLQVQNARLHLSSASSSFLEPL